METDGARAVSVVRPDDLLALTFEFHNLRLDEDGRQLVVVDSSKAAFVIAHFPPQHLAEHAYTTQPLEVLPWPPVPSRLSGASRLAFRLRGNVKAIDFDLATLLDWSRRGDLEHNLVPATRSPKEIADGAPKPYQTAIEAPYRLFLSPEWTTAWQSVPGPVSLGSVDAGVRTELWHVRLVGVSYDDPARRVPAEVRAVWSPDYMDDGADPSDDTAFDTPLRPHYTDIIKRTHRKDLDPEPITAHNLMLSSLGAWLNLDGPQLPGPDSVKLDRWTQRTAFGQDELVVIEDKGFLLPTGHPVSLVTVTRRLFEVPEGDVNEQAPPDQSRGGYLRTRQFIKIKAPVQDFQGDWRMPLRNLEVLDRTTPTLNVADTSKPFWITVGDPARNHPFRGRGQDWDGDAVNLTFAAMFVPSDAPADQVDAAKATYQAATDARDIAMNGQEVTVASPAANGATKTSDNTRVELLRLSLSAGEPTPAQTGPHRAPFTPVAEALQARLPTVRDFVPEQSNQDWFELADVAAEGNVGGVFLKRKESESAPIPLNFSGGRMGSLVVPSMQIAGVCRRLGPFGDAAPLLGGDFDPARYFCGGGDLEARLLGGIPLSEVLVAGPIELSALPSIISSTQPSDQGDIRELSIRWENGALQKDPSENFLPGDACQLSLAALARSDSKGHSTVSTRAVLKDYAQQVELIPGLAAIQFQYDHTEYRAGPGQQPHYDPGLVNVEMTGLLLKIVEFLARSSVASLTAKKKGTGLSFTVTVKADRIELQIGWDKKREKDPDDPDAETDVIPYGPTLLFYNVGFSLGATVYFERKPVEFSLALASPTKPFFVGSVASIWGGGGSFGVTVTTRAAVTLKFSLAIGAVKSIEIGGAKGRIMATAGVLLTYRVSEGKLEFAFIITFAGGVELTEWLKISVSFILELTPVDSIAFQGVAKVSLKVKIAFFSFGFSFKFQMYLTGPDLRGKRLLGSNGTPAGFDDVMSLADWSTYRQAFAP